MKELNSTPAVSNKFTYKHTIYACFTGYVVQAVVNNFIPLLFLLFHNTYQIPLSKITFLITLNFVFQLAVDLIAVTFVDRIGYRASAILAHGFAALGLLSLTFLPEIFADPFIGILLAVMLYAIGGGLLEVLISPMVEACPTDNKEKAMSLLHSFYCWGQVGVVLLSTLFFTIFGIENWRYMAFFWALLPIANLILFTKVPIVSLLGTNEKGLTLKELASKKIFWILILLMLCAGASELSISQWASTFAELGLGLSKTTGDLAGPMFFAICMGITRVIYGKFGERINLERFMTYSGICCVIGYLLTALSPTPILGLIGCSICGFSVGILWPGTFSRAAAKLKRGGTLMFAFFALSGDIGCSLGPTLVGQIAGSNGENIHQGILLGIIFPILLLIGLGMLRFTKSHNSK